MLKARELGVSYRDKTVIKGLDITLEDGFIYALTGPSGSGKSTLLKRLAGLLGEDVKTEGEIKEEGGFLYTLQDQFASFSPVYRIGEDLKILLKLERHKGDFRAKIKEALLWCGLKAEDALLYPFALSGGMLERALLAKVYLSNKRNLLMDEPTSSLDLESEEILAEKLRDLTRERNIMSLVVTHSKRLIRLLGAKELILENGRIKNNA